MAPLDRVGLTVLVDPLVLKELPGRVVVQQVQQGLQVLADRQDQQEQELQGQQAQADRRDRVGLQVQVQRVLLALQDRVVQADQQE